MKRIPFRRARRGAVFVEAIVVVSFFTLCFLGVLYFRELYLAKMRVQRLARASAMAHAMSACTADPKAGLETELPGPPVRGSEPGPEFDLSSGDSLATKALDTLASVVGTAVNPIHSVTLKTSASATTRPDPASPKQGFESEVGSSSFVTCMDPVSPGQFEEIAPKVVEVFKSFFPF